MTRLIKQPTTIAKISLVLMLAIVVGSCQKDYLVPKPVPKPKVSKETSTLEASYLKDAPSTVNSPYWNTADFLKVDLQDVNKQSLYQEDGLLNVTEGYNGLSTFNDGENVEALIKAAYDDENIYILVQWNDNDRDASRFSSLYNGPEDPLQAGMSSEFWTSQRNDDQLSFAFDLQSATGTAGTFQDVGCASTCHNGEMKTQSGKVDVWNWSLALSEPMGYALDMVCDASGLSLDQGTPMYARNAVGHRSGPTYEWDGTEQKITKADGSTAILDPAFYLLNKTAFVGDAEAGRLIYEPKCGETCHGVYGEGNGPDLDGIPFNKPGEMNRFSRAIFEERASALEHSGYVTFNTLTAQEVEDVIALIRGFSGVPGFYLQEPDGSNADITANSNVVTAKVTPAGTQYKVLLIRKLNTGNADDIAFEPNSITEYPFGMALMDADGRNHIGTLKETLTFLKP